ncbi:unnamed protein product [Nesidiocoris tenuis]|uniref:Arf-GAP domain-containing protein n=1 Tax=Nesidiocoris tenuis TaxID=355587 RepID=A0A6H5H8T5_9HEMI|nr:unnamed protein product [Nesidiocoris tenuis]
MSSANKPIKHTEVCADCGSLDPPWALVNRGLLVCDECCSVHRSLGKHISDVKSLKRAHWSISQLKMVYALNNGGVNNLWEHSLPEFKSWRKPTPKDPLHPNKADFIRAKHRDLTFVLRVAVPEDELHLQLHSSVRTSNLETSLRLLAQGADPNFLHPDKGSTAFHVAAKAGQLAQIELLFVHGADPTLKDVNGNSAMHVARLAGHRDVQMRITEMLYTVTDRLIYFLTRLRPDHMAGQHFILPDERDCIVTPAPAEHGQAMLFQLTNPLFGDLAMDVYDEIDRRETETIWLSSGASLEYSTVPFLPVNPDFSALRNQGRQKLARLSAQEFTALCFNILHDANRRQSVKNKVSTPDDEPLYDSVASDEDYATAEQLAIMVAQNSRGLPLKLVETAKSTSAKSETAVERELRDKLKQARDRESQLAAQVQQLNKRVEDMNRENENLRRSLKASVVSSSESSMDPVMELRGGGSSSGGSHPGSPRPVSMYEVRDSLRVQNNVMPLSEEVIRRTGLVTKRIQRSTHRVVVHVRNVFLHTPQLGYTFGVHQFENSFSLVEPLDVAGAEIIVVQQDQQEAPEGERTCNKETHTRLLINS